MEKRFPQVPPAPCEDATIWTLRMAPEDISHINGILQAYEGMGIVRTIDNKTALIEVWVMPLYEDDFLTVLEDLARETDFTIVEKERPFDGADSL